MKTIYKCRDKTKILEKPGNKGEDDGILFTVPPKPTWATTMEYIGALVCRKSQIEDANYPPPKQGRKMFQNYLIKCSNSKLSEIPTIVDNYLVPKKGCKIKPKKKGLFF